jgi:DNA-directed RNA polymerase subunit RPC12/RpoP
MNERRKKRPGQANNTGMNKVEFICLDCGKTFLAPQGSRRRFCNDCWIQHALNKNRAKKLAVATRKRQKRRDK